MEQDNRALIVAWLTLAVNTLTLAVASIGVLGLLSLGPVQRLVCRQFSFDCTFEATDAVYLTFDVEPQPARPSDSMDPAPPGLVEGIAGSSPSTTAAWSLLANAADATCASLGVPEELFSFTGCAAVPTCVPVNSLSKLIQAEKGPYPMADAEWRWKIRYVAGAVDKTLAGDNANPRSIGFEFDTRYAPLHRDVAVRLRVMAFDAGSFGRPAIPLGQLDSRLTLPAGSETATFLCRLPELPPGSYRVALTTSGGEGDWESQFKFPDLLVIRQPAVPREPAQPQDGR